MSLDRCPELISIAVPAGFAAAGGNTGAAMPGGWSISVEAQAEPGKMGGSSGVGSANSTLADTSLQEPGPHG